MATLNRGITFSSTETITNTKLHLLVDNATISGIVDADISPGAAIQFSKLLASAIDASLLVNLANMVAGAGKIPFANLPVPFGSTYVSLISIPNLSLQPIVLASWIDGISFRNLQSSPSLAGQFPYWSLVGSLGSGSFPAFDGVSKFVGSSGAAIAVLGDYPANSTSFNSLSPVYNCDTQRTANTGLNAYTKTKALLVPRNGAVRIKFDIKHSTGVGSAAGRIYRNGVAVGTIQLNATSSFVTYSEDISGWTAGDSLELWGDETSHTGGIILLRNLRVYEALPITPYMVIYDQDPS